MYDLIIKGASILDGSGKEAYCASVMISDGRIVKIGESIEDSAKRVINAEGLTLTPGWIDSHSHSDRNFLSDPDMKEKVEQGITFSLAGQCGSSAAPVIKDGKILKMSEYLADAEKIAQGSSAATFVGFNTIRKAVIGVENRDPSPEELSAMCDLLRDAIRGGAIGMSYGIYYVPASYAKTEELIALAKVAREEGGILSAHIRNESDELLSAVEEFLTIIKASGCRAVFSHHKAAGKENWGNVKKSIAMIEKANAEGCEVYFDVYPYIASGTTMMARFCPANMHPEGTKRALDLLYDPEMCEKLKIWGREKWGETIDWTLIASCPGREDLQGKTVSEAAKILGLSDDEYEAALEIIRISGGRARGSFFSMCEADVEYVMRHPRSMICTDSGVAGISTIYHPRLRAAFPRVLGRYVRERGVVALPEMIRKMTSLPAHVYGLKTKGLIAEGMDADICIFNPDTIIDKADFVNCTENNEGIEYVIIAGEVVLEKSVYLGKRAGKIHRV